jgi:hypothetical protein
MNCRRFIAPLLAETITYHDVAVGAPSITSLSSNGGGCQAERHGFNVR